MICAFCGTKILKDDKRAKWNGIWLIHKACLGFAIESHWNPTQGTIQTHEVSKPPERGMIKNFAFGTVCYKDLKPWYTWSLLETYRGLSRDHKIWPEAFLSQGLYIISARNYVVLQVKKWSISDPIAGILWLDSDMQWEYSDVLKILEVAGQNPEAIVGCLYAGREHDAVIGRVTEPGKDVSNADHLGFGFTYTPLSCFDKPSPWFFNGWEEGTDNIIGEDVWFCREQKKLGRKILGIRSSNVRHGYEPGPRLLRGNTELIIGQTSAKSI